MEIAISSTLQKAHFTSRNLSLYLRKTKTLEESVFLSLFENNLEEESGSLETPGFELKMIRILRDNTKKINKQNFDCL